MKIYVASSWRTENHPEVINMFKTAGYDVYDYRSDGFEWNSLGVANVDVTFEKLQEVLLTEECQRKAAMDEDRLLEADALVLILPAGRSAHTELGRAIGLGIVTVVIWSPSEPELMHGWADFLVDSPETALEVLRETETNMDIVSTLGTPVQA